MKPLQSLEHRSVTLRRQPPGDMHAVVRVDSDQMRVEGRVMRL